MTAKEKINNLQRTVTMLANLAQSADLISCDLRLTGSMLVDNGEKLERLADKLNLPMAYEPYTGESGKIEGVFWMFHVDDAEIMYMDAACIPEEDAV